MAHEIDFEIIGNEMQIAQIELDPGESVVAEAGSMMYVDNGIQLDTIFGDGSDKNASDGLLGKLVGAGKRMITGESLFMTMFTNQGNGKQKVAFAAPYPGKILPMDLSALGNKLVCQKDCFLCAAKGVSIGIELTRKLGAGFFGGEGFILQKLEGDGMAFVHAGGTVIARELQPGETLRVDTGCLVAFTQGVTYDIQMVKGIKTALFGGEGLFYATLTGPGMVWIQSLPIDRLANRILQAAPAHRDESTPLGGLGSLLQGDR